MRKKLAIFAMLMLCGCATRYQEMGLSGGVAAEQVTADTWRIKARGNAYTSATTVQDYVLLKAAETTKATGGTHFVIVSANDANRAFEVTTAGSSTTTFAGRQAYTTYTPGSTTTAIKPGQDVYIKVLKLAPNQTAQGAISAAEVIQFTGARVGRD